MIWVGVGVAMGFMLCACFLALKAASYWRCEWERERMKSAVLVTQCEMLHEKQRELREALIEVHEKQRELREALIEEQQIIGWVSMN